MTDRVVWPCCSAARLVARSTSRLCLSALMWAALQCLTQPATAGFTQGNVPKLTASDGVGSAEQGFSVAVSADGCTAIVGGPFDGSGAGAAWVFTLSGGTWIQQQKLTASEENGTAELGWSVALSTDGNTAIVGGPGDNSSSGAAWVFTRSSSGTWSQQGAKLSGGGAVGPAEQGYSVALSGDGTTAIVGGWADNNALGAAWVFTFSGGGWTQQGAKLSANDASAATNVLQGFSVALSNDGNTALVGGPNDKDGVGAAWVFTRSGVTWTQPAPKLANSDGVESQQGFSVALGPDGKTALLGGPGEETPGTDTIDGKSVSVTMSKGAAWVFTGSGTTWTQQGGMLVGTSAATSNPGQGFSVALGGGGARALVGGPAANANTGATWVFARTDGTWNPLTKLIATDTAGAAGQGAAVALSGNGTTAIVGGALDQDQTGAAWVSVARATHDFNGDGKSDVLWRDTAGNVGMWLMNGPNVLSSTGLGKVTANWSIVGTGDFNGDGKADILWHDIAGDVGMWLMDGPNILSTAGFGKVATNWSIVGTGDFNGDGKADILWLDNQGDLGIWLMSGMQILQSVGVGKLPDNWTVVGSDTNGDIFLRNTASGDVGMWVVNGAQIVQTVDFGPVPLNWSVAGIGDFDGNGSFDILWRDTAGDIGIWLLKGTQVISTAVLGNVPSNWTIAETGDYNGDTSSDIFWTDNLGNVGTWFMNGATVSSSTDYGSVGSAWSVQSLNAD